MEEDIKILENFIQYNKFYKEENGKLTITIDLDVKTTLDKAIENLLTRYKQLEEKELEDNSKTMLVKFEHEQDLQLCMEVLQKLLEREGK